MKKVIIKTKNNTRINSSIIILGEVVNFNKDGAAEIEQEKALEMVKKENYDLFFEDKELQKEFEKQNPELFTSLEEVIKSDLKENKSTKDNPDENKQVEDNSIKINLIKECKELFNEKELEKINFEGLKVEEIQTIIENKKEEVKKEKQSFAIELGKKNLPEIKIIAEEADLPKIEWQDKTKKDLIKYIINNI